MKKIFLSEDEETVRAYREESEGFEFE